MAETQTIEELTEYLRMGFTELIEQIKHMNTHLLNIETDIRRIANKHSGTIRG